MVAKIDVVNKIYIESTLITTETLRNKKYLVETSKKWCELTSMLHVQVSWHDLAFFDPILYEGLRKLIVSARQDHNSMKDMGELSVHLYSLCIHCVDLSWQVTLGEYEGGATHCLLSSPSDRSVKSVDVYKYVQLYAELRMIRVIEEPLQVCPENEDVKIQE